MQTAGGLRRLPIGIFLAVLVVAGLLASPAGAATRPFCGITWGSMARQSGTATGLPLVDVRAGGHLCYDRLVLDLDGPVGGYNVRYGQVLSEGRGAPVPVSGGASLDIVVFAPSYDLNGAPTFAPPDPTNIVNVRGFRTFRQVASGGSFEGHTTMGLGVRARLPFRVFVLAGPGSHARLVIDVAHRW